MASQLACSKCLETVVTKNQTITLHFHISRTMVEKLLQKRALTLGAPVYHLDVPSRMDLPIAKSTKEPHLETNNRENKLW